MSNINDAPYGNVATLLFSKVWVLAYGVRTDVPTYVRTDSHMTTEIFEISEEPNFLKYGAPLVVRLRHSGAWLKHV